MLTYIINTILISSMFNGIPLNSKQTLNRKIIIEFEVSDTQKKVDRNLFWTEANYISNKPQWKESKLISAGKVDTWHINSHEPIVFQPGSFIQGLLEPGDSIHCVSVNNEIKYSGRGAEKLYLNEKIRNALKGIKKTVRERQVNFDLKYFYLWNEYLNQCRSVIDSLMDNYKPKISPFAYEFVKSREYSLFEHTRGRKFLELIRTDRTRTLNEKSISEIYSLTVGRPDNKWLITASGTEVHYLVLLTDIELIRENRFNLQFNFSPKTRTSYLEASLKKAKQLYSGRLLETTLAYLMTNDGIHIMRMYPGFDKILADYYSKPGYPEYRRFVKDYEEKEIAINLRKGVTAPMFFLENENGESFSSLQMNGKPMLLFFWQSGNDSCSLAVKEIERIWEKYKLDSAVSIVTVYAGKDKELWKQSIMAGQFTIRRAQHLSGGKSGNVDLVLKGFKVESLPTLFMIDATGKFAEYPAINPAKDKGKQLDGFFSHQSALLLDGPYVLYESDSVVQYSLNGSKIHIQKSVKKDSCLLYATSDAVEESFQIDLKKKLDIEASEYPRSEKLFVLSDIEGNFEAFRKLLDANKIIDKNFNWIFGKGHLVFAGDMFDRGNQVTECLWLIYTLEEKAKAAGGYVHFILGNHEIMNLQGDFRYVAEKYKDNAALMGKTLKQLYDEDSELGRWLRTKNIVEKIGDLLFLHGGISTEMNRLKLTTTTINKLARPNYANKQIDYKDLNTNTIMSDTYGPFWYRGYYDEKGKVTENSVDSILYAFDIKHLVTGHTVVADTISTHYNNKVINTDTKHAKGISEALLIEGNSFYRANAEGKRVLLFKDDEK